jgi:hypothetical protein
MEEGAKGKIAERQRERARKRERVLGNGECGVGCKIDR